jgi:hypothetical protein
LNTRSKTPQLPNDPVTPKDALSRPDADNWKLAMEEEYQTLLANGTWELSDVPPGRQPIQCKWVFKTKLGVTGEIDRYKARLVIKGYSQRMGEDYDETYAPVVRQSSLRYLFAFAAQHGLDIEQMDAVSAFLQGELDEEIYMEQPPLFKNPENPNKCLRLKKALYGLKQGSRVWNQKLDKAMKKFGLEQSKYDTCLYYKFQDKKILMVAVYVDDMLIFSNDTNLTQSMKQHLNQEFQMKDLGSVKHCLGIRINKTSKCITLDQEQYIESILSRFGFSNCKAVQTPMNPKEVLSKDDCPKSPEEVEEMTDIPYQEAIGCLMYLSQCTRPDITFAVNKLSRFSSNPGPKHWQGVKHVFRYLRGTSNHQLKYSKSDTVSDITGFVDADWGSEIEDRKSTTGFVFMSQGGAISWCSKKQPTVALSSCEAEYMGLSAAVQEALWWQGLKSQLGNPEPLEIMCDNQSAIALATNGGFNPRTKHIDIRHHFIHDTLNQGKIKLSYVPTEDQLADALTKSLDKIKNDKFKNQMGIRSSD